MKILIFSNSIWNILNFRYPLIREISKKNQVIVYCNKKKNFNIDKKNKSKLFKIKNINYSSKSQGIYDNAVLLYRLFLIIKKEKPNMILSFTLKPNLYCGFLSYIFKYSFIPTLSGLGTAYNKGGLFFFFIKILIRISFKNIRKVFVHNSNERKILSNLGVKNKEIVEVNGSGINLNHFTKLNLTKTKYNNKFLYIGRLLKDKGIYELIKAFKMLKSETHPSLTLAIIIDEDNSSFIKIRYLKKKFGKSKIFLKKNVLNVRKLIKTHDCIVLPSYSEGMSRSIMEAASSGRAVLCSNINGCKEMVKNNYNGFLFEPKSTKSLYKALSKFTNLSYNEKVKFGLNSRVLLKKNRFDEKNVIDKYISQIKNENH